MQNKQQEHTEMQGIEWIELLSELQQDNPEFQDCINNIILFLKASSISTPSVPNSEEHNTDL